MKCEDFGFQVPFSLNHHNNKTTFFLYMYKRSTRIQYEFKPWSWCFYNGFSISERIHLFFSASLKCIREIRMSSVSRNRNMGFITSSLWNQNAVIQHNTNHIVSMVNLFVGRLFIWLRSERWNCFAFLMKMQWLKVISSQLLFGILSLSPMKSSLSFLTLSKLAFEWPRLGLSLKC